MTKSQLKAKKSKVVNVHQQNWEAILLILRDDDYSDIHKFYSKSGGWCNLTDRTGERYEILKGDSPEKLKEVMHHIRKVNNYISIHKRPYNFRKKTIHALNR